MRHRRRGAACGVMFAPAGTLWRDAAGRSPWWWTTRTNGVSAASQAALRRKADRQILVKQDAHRPGPHLAPERASPEPAPASSSCARVRAASQVATAWVSASSSGWTPIKGGGPLKTETVSVRSSWLPSGPIPVSRSAIDLPLCTRDREGAVTRRPLPRSRAGAYRSLWPETRKSCPSRSWKRRR